MPDFRKQKIRGTLAGLELTAAEEMYDRALAALARGPVAFGENHTIGVCRCVIWDLIRAGRVLRLFLELQDDQTETNTAYLQHLVRQSSYHPGDAGLRGIVDKLNGKEVGSSLIRQASNPVPMGDLVAAAVDNGVRVYFYDKPTAATAPDASSVAQRRAQRKRDQAAVSDEGIGDRNLHSASVFQRAPDHRAPGSVLLGGSLHFNAGRVQDRSLLRLLSIGDEQYFQYPPA